MLNDNGHASARNLFRLCAELRDVSGALPRTSARDRPALIRRRDNLLVRMLRTLEKPSGLTGFLKELRDRHDLEPRCMLVILMLLAERIETGPEWVGGRSLLRPMCRDTLDLLRCGKLLQDASPLFRKDILRSQSLITDSVLDGDYRIAEWVYEHFVQDVLCESDERTQPRAYVSSAAHLLDMKHLVELYQIRAAGIFDDSCWRDFFPEADSLTGDVAPMILQARAAISAREARHTENEKLPVVALRSEFGLSEEEEIVLLAVLFHELFTAPPLLEAAELVRLISADEDDLFRKRRILSHKGRLREGGMVLLEAEIEGKDLVGEVYVAPWIEERLLEGIDEGTAIDAQECRTFHRYLKRLRNSDDFYRNL